MSFLFAVRQEVCAQPLEVKLNDVRFVCFPMVLHSSGQQTNQAPMSVKRPLDDDKSELANILLFNIVFGLQVQKSRKK